MLQKHCNVYLNKGITMATYNIPTAPFIAPYAPGGVETLSEEEKKVVFLQAAQDLIPLIRDGTIWFPYHKYFSLPPEEMFANLKTTHLATENDFYRLRSYYPKYATYLPPKFRGKFVVLANHRGDYSKADLLSDYFIEDVRMRAKRYDQEYSISECWNIDSCLPGMLTDVFKHEYITPPTVRESIYLTTPETKTFRPSRARGLLELVMGPKLAHKKWLDISAGWGDRLLAAMSLDMDYVGFDPNTDLRHGHSQMIAKFGDPTRHRVIYEPFEKAEIPPGPYDVVLTSPPYFDLENYGSHEGQSIVNYPGQSQWMVWFLFVALMRAWENLKVGGYIILHLGDARTITTCEAANIFIENYLPNASWEGVLGVKDVTGFPRPVWVWKKIGPRDRKYLWEPSPKAVEQGAIPSAQRTLYRTYPELQTELIKYYGSKYAQAYPIKRSTVTAVRDHVAAALPSTERAIVDSLLSDDLAVYSVLEVLQPDATVAFFTALVAQYPNMDSATVVSQASAQAPYYAVRIQSADAVRAHVMNTLPHLSPEDVNLLLGDNMLITTLLESISPEDVIKWCTAMMKLSLRN